MKKLVWTLFSALVLAPMTFAACDGGEEDAAGRLEVACEKACDKLAAADCEEVNVGNCSSACGYFVEQLDGFCVEEYADNYECAAEIDYTCKDGYPYPEDLDAAAACNESTQKLSVCLQGLGCKKFCRAASEAGCGGTSEALCVQECEASRPADVFCAGDYDQLRDCQTEDMECEGGKPSSAACDYERESLVECLSSSSGDGDPCGGYCFLAIDEGCEKESATACQAECQAMFTQAPPGAESCSYEFDDIKSCEGQGMTCQGGAPVLSASGCTYEKQEAADCLFLYQQACLAGCWYAEVMGCGTGDVGACASECDAEQQAKPQCEYYHEDLTECQVQQNTICDPTNTACQYEQEQYQNCLTQQ